MHFLIESPDVSHFLYRLGFGIFAGLIYLKTGSLWKIVGLHTGWNLISLVVGETDWKVGNLVRLSGLNEQYEIGANIFVLFFASAVYGFRIYRQGIRTP